MLRSFDQRGFTKMFFLLRKKETWPIRQVSQTTLSPLSFYAAVVHKQLKYLYPFHGAQLH